MDEFKCGVRNSECGMGSRGGRLATGRFGEKSRTKLWQLGNWGMRSAKGMREAQLAGGSGQIAAGRKQEAGAAD